MREPSSVTTRPFTRTRPAAISSSETRREAMPAADITFCSRTRPDSSSAGIGVDRFGAGQQGRERRQVGERTDAEGDEELVRGPVQHGARLLGPADLLDEALG